MPVQTYQSTLAKRLGQKVVAAHTEHKDKPVDTGDMRLPGGIKGGIAQLNKMYIGQYKPDVKDESKRGQEFLRVSGVVKTPKAHDGVTCEGLVTSVIVPLCDEPARGKRDAKTFADNWAEFQNTFQLFGVDPPNVDNIADGDKRAAAIMSYYQASMTALMQRKPHFNFSTREWTPPALPEQEQGTPMLFETWHTECQYNGVVDPLAGVSLPAQELQPEPFTEPPSGVPQTPTAAPTTEDSSDEIVALVELVMADPNRLTEAISDEAAQAVARLTELAKAAGATDDQITAATDYDIIGQMALGSFEDVPTALTLAATPTVGQKAKFRKRDSKGETLKDGKKQPFPAQEIEVVTVDSTNKTITAKTTKEGKPVVDLKKNVIHIRWEWLE